jgi:16S rRNA (cytidine1402-2'-O)-methyltransferase
VGTLYLVATPIGNLEDVSARTLRILREVRCIAAEDTRRTAKLLNHFDIHTPLISFHEHSRKNKLANLLAELETGDLALVSDAGTPLINDPGAELVIAAVAAGHQICPIPGPSAPLAALVASGLPAEKFLYLGYLPRKTGERQVLLREIADLPYTLIFLETPHRLVDALGDLEQALGDRQIAVARELTKLHEEILRVTISQARTHFTHQTPRGEFTLVVAGAPPQAKEIWSLDKLQAALQEQLAQGLSPSQVASLLAVESGWPRREIYRMLTKLEG